MEAVKEIINDSAPYLTVDGKDNLKVKEVLLNDNRYIVCLNEEEAKHYINVVDQAATINEERLKFQKLLEETGSKYGYTDVIRSLRKVNIVKLKVKEREHLVRTEVHGAANIAFRAVGAKIPESTNY